MGYYDDWVDPNGTFRRRRGDNSDQRGQPKKHLRGPLGCGVDVRLTENIEEVTCGGCLKKANDHD